MKGRELIRSCAKGQQDEMQRVVLVLAMAFALVAVVLAGDSSGSSGNAGETATVNVDDTHNSTVVEPAAAFVPRPNENGDASSAVKTPSDGNGDGQTKLAVAVVVGVSVAGLLLGLTLIMFAWRASKRQEEAMFLDVGDERNYVYGQFGDYAAM
ncbi:Inactive leucine-rich repeat receptor-like protein kinase [Phytophthora cinnamomi]|uniref:Inactive leucine-rich repeat receptor-like protein kinase n=1 Tax=Phytophthora cinnamomi TaxID=4785 RepID=UPI0035594F5B|nr:Inactive leucine-rich repeat receptor-like protein kinase [Phytophthora cinnamomi]